MAFSYDEISTQLEKLSDIIQRSRARSIHTENYNKSVSQTKQTVKSVNSYHSKTQTKPKTRSPKHKKLSKLERNPRLCPWIELDDQIKDFQNKDINRKPTKKKAKTAPPSVTKKKPTKIIQKDSNNDAKTQQFRDSPSFYSYDDYDEYYPYYSYSDYSMGSDQEDFLISEIEGPINKGIVKQCFKKWEKRFLARISLLIQRELHQSEDSKDKINQKKEETEKKTYDKQTNQETKPRKTFNDVDSDQKEQLIDIIFNSSQ